ncbi:MAG: type II toxin-antitoxin system HigB family toxin [Moorea sp. SIO2B7]|nr:type II toxin-antitoxin system HigB family toxin [Moorena sp. SIO2B7]
MHVISRRILREFCAIHADACDALYDWYRVARKKQWQNLADIQVIYKSVEAVGKFTVFNIKGNHYRLIIDIIYYKAA